MSPENAAEALFRARKILCIQPHYDDNDIYAGGTLALLHDLGAELTYLTVTDDLVGVLDQSLPDREMEELLRSEQVTAGRSIGVGRHTWLGYPDAGPLDYYRLRTDIIACLRSTLPDFVFTVDPWLPYEAHRDHILTGQAAAEAVYLVNFPRLKTRAEIDDTYRHHDIQGVAFYNTASPNKTIDISRTFERKHQAIRAYKAQFMELDMEQLILECDKNEKKAAERDGYRRAERFKIVHPSQLHCNTETWKSGLD